MYIANISTKQKNISFTNWLENLLPNDSSIVKTTLTTTPLEVVKVDGIPSGINIMGGLHYFVHNNNIILTIGAGPYTSDNKQQIVDGKKSEILLKK